MADYTNEELIARLLKHCALRENSVPAREAMEEAADALNTLVEENKQYRLAGNKLSLAAQTTGGTAGRDEGLQEAIAGWSQALSQGGK